MSRLQSANISPRYSGSDATVVEGLNLTVQGGLITTIIGPNGCGKSTRLRALGRLLRPHAGSVVLDGQLIHQVSTKEVARRLGLMRRPSMKRRPTDGRPRGCSACRDLASALLRRAVHTNLAQAPRTNAGRPRQAVALVASAGAS